MHNVLVAFRYFLSLFINSFFFWAIIRLPRVHEAKHFGFILTTSWLLQLYTYIVLTFNMVARQRGNSLF